VSIDHEPSDQLEVSHVNDDQWYVQVRARLSLDRLSSYLSAANGDERAGLRLYVWNASLSGAFWPVLHMNEVILRNAVAAVLTRVYGTEWHFNRTFLESMPAMNRSAFLAEREKLSDSARRKRRDLIAGDVVARQTYQFWVSMLTARYEDRLWKRHLTLGFPNLGKGVTREVLWRETDGIRRFRNRIAHHEPLLADDVAAQYTVLNRLIQWVCPTTAAWVVKEWPVESVVSARPS
jgi:hypothetical protein